MGNGSKMLSSDCHFLGAFLQKFLPDPGVSNGSLININKKNALGWKIINLPALSLEIKNCTFDA